MSKLIRKREIEQELPGRHRYTPRGTLVAIGLKVQQQGILEPVRESVKIGQKAVKYTPFDKLNDCLLTILAGGGGLVEANKRVRPDRVLQLAFGRDGCAEQSVISQTLDASTPDNVHQMQRAMRTIYQQHSLGYQHDYAQQLQIVDIDMTGQPCGKKAAFATKGYFAHQRNRRGRQLGRVLATRYDEIVVDRLYDGKTQLPRAFQPLVEAAEATLELDTFKRTRTVLRADGGAGSQGDVNWALARGYNIHTKEYNGRRARTLAASVDQWHDDPKVKGRHALWAGWVTAEPTEYVKPVKRIAVRTRKKNGQWAVGVLLSTLTAAEVVPLARLPIERTDDPVAVLCAYVYFYDLRSGGVETQIKGDKQGLGITKRNKKRFEAQQMLIQLNALAHNLIIWARRWLQSTYDRLREFGITRMVRDVFHVPGLVLLGDGNRIVRIVLQATDPLAGGLSPGLTALLKQVHVAVTLDEI